MFWGDTLIDSLLGPGVPSAQELRAIVSVFASAPGTVLYDSAEGYGFGSSETRLAQAQPRGLVVTKFMPVVWRWTRAQFFGSLAHSTERLGRVPDVYFIHTPVHPQFASMVAWACEAKAQGLINGVGLSNCGADEVELAVRIAAQYGERIAANQILFSLLDYASPALQRVVRLCEDLRIRVVAYSVLGQGLLTDRLTPETYSSIRATKMLRGLTYERLVPLRATLAELATAHKTTMAAVAINWALCKHVVPLIGVTTEKTAREAVAACSWRLSAEEVARLDAQALDVSTLDKPRFRRVLFVILISLLLVAYMLTRPLSYRFPGKKRSKDE